MICKLNMDAGLCIPGLNDSAAICEILHRRVFNRFNPDEVRRLEYMLK